MRHCHPTDARMHKWWAVDRKLHKFCTNDGEERQLETAFCALLTRSWRRWGPALNIRSHKNGWWEIWLFCASDPQRQRKSHVWWEMNANSRAKTANEWKNSKIHCVPTMGWKVFPISVFWQFASHIWVYICQRWKIFGFIFVRGEKYLGLYLSEVKNNRVYICPRRKIFGFIFVRCENICKLSILNWTLVTFLKIEIRRFRGILTKPLEIEQTYHLEMAHCLSAFWHFYWSSFTNFGGNFAQIGILQQIFLILTSCWCLNICRIQ